MSVLEKVVFLHPLSPKKRGAEKKRQLFETDEKIEIACVIHYIIRYNEDTKTSQKGKTSNSYNEEFDPGSG